MNKRDFLEQYVLARAATVGAGSNHRMIHPDIPGIVADSVQAWYLIEKECPAPKVEPPLGWPPVPDTPEERYNPADVRIVEIKK